MKIHKAVDYLKAQSTIMKITNDGNDPMMRTMTEAIDVLCDYVKTIERKKSIEFVNPYLTK